MTTHDSAIARCVRDIIEVSELLEPWAANERRERERLGPLVAELKRRREERHGK